MEESLTQSPEVGRSQPECEDVRKALWPPIRTPYQPAETARTLRDQGSGTGSEDSDRVSALVEIHGEQDAVNQLCKELGLETSHEQALAAMFVRNVMLANRFSEQMNPGKDFENKIWPPHVMDRISLANLQRLKTESGAARAIQALWAIRCPQPVILATKIDIHGGCTP